MRKKVKGAFLTARANFDSWAHSLRTVIMLLFVVLFILVVCTNKMKEIGRMNRTVYYMETLYDCLSKGCNITMTSILLLITLNDLPKKSNLQYNLLIRASRAEWLAGQMLYCLWMVLLMLFLVIFSAMMFLLPLAGLGNRWSDTGWMAEDVITEGEAMVPAFIRENFSPLSASLTALVPMLLFWLCMTLLILFSGLCNAPLVGVLIYAVMLLGHLILFVEAFPPLPLPIYDATLGNIIGSWEEEEAVKLSDAAVRYGAALLILFCGMAGRVKRMDYKF